MCNTAPLWFNVRKPVVGQQLVTDKHMKDLRIIGQLPQVFSRNFPSPAKLFLGVAQPLVHVPLVYMNHEAIKQRFSE